MSYYVIVCHIKLLTVEKTPRGQWSLWLPLMSDLDYCFRDLVSNLIMTRAQDVRWKTLRTSYLFSMYWKLRTTYLPRTIARHRHLWLTFRNDRTPPAGWPHCRPRDARFSDRYQRARKNSSTCNSGSSPRDFSVILLIDDIIFLNYRNIQASFWKI